jgi:peptide methionine sulfoxide reductase MsrA
MPIGIRDLHVRSGAASGGEASRDACQQRLDAAGYRPITTEIAGAPPVCGAEDYHQQHLAKNPDGYCGIGGTVSVVLWV